MVANQTLHRTAMASAGRNGWRRRGWLHRMSSPFTVASPAQGTRVSDEASPAQTPPPRVATLKTIGSTGVAVGPFARRRRRPRLPSTMARRQTRWSNGCPATAWRRAGEVRHITALRAEVQAARVITPLRETSRRRPTLISRFQQLMAVLYQSHGDLRTGGLPIARRRREQRPGRARPW